MQTNMQTRFLQSVLADAHKQLANGAYGAKRLALETLVRSTTAKLATMGMPESARRL